MKIGLLTYHFSNNYGAVLQTYATCRILKELGHEVEIINIRQLEKKKLRHVVFIPKDLAFKRFMDNFYPSQTTLIKSYKELKERQFDYDCLLVGSDQVWNPNISLDKYLAYFLDFGSKSMRRISYASSFGLSEWPNNIASLIPNIKNALNRFDALSVREETGKNLLKKTFGLSSTVVLDPTMLHTSYKEIVPTIAERNDIVCYFLNKTSVQFKVARYLSKTRRIPASIITSIPPVLGLKYVYPPSIEKWLRCIGGAKFVLTDSFHGLVFSLLYKRNFAVIAVNNGKNSRLLDLLHLVGLDDRYFLTYEDFIKSNSYNKDIDYKKVDAILNVKRQASIDYLKKALAQ